MKKTILFAIAALALAGFSPSASAQTSVSSGAVNPTCSLTVTDGNLPQDEIFTFNLTTSNTSADRGRISTVCNSTSSTLRVELSPGVHPPLQPGLTESFALNVGTGAYAAGLPTAFRTIPYTKTNLINTYSSAASEIGVRARVSVPSTRFLAAGDYTVNVRVTITP
jgi:hypothetical protein